MSDPHHVPSGRTARRAAAAIGAAAILVAPTAWSPAQARVEAEDIFRDARAYTVRVRTQITTPFIEDVRGSFEGAGFLIDAERGWIVTNAHVVGQSPSQVQIAFVDESFRPARKVYVDPFVDVAILAVEGTRGRSTAKLACRSVAVIGEPVGAFGHPLGMYFTGTRGIVSGKTDQLGPDLLQVDATVDHGNSGGPTLALRDGRVLGIATAGAGSGTSARVNFATPMKDVCRIVSLLRNGASPSPPRMEFSLLRDEDGRHTLRVANSFDPERWPFEPGDRIVAVGADRDTLRTLGDLVSALRGRAGRVPLLIERGGRKISIEVTPAPRSPIVTRRAISVDGALIAPIRFDDEVSLREPGLLFVHSVEPGSSAEMRGLQEADILHNLDDTAFADLDSLWEHLQRRPAETPMRIVLRRFSPSRSRIFDYHVRELPAEEVRLVGPDPNLATSRQDD